MGTLEPAETLPGPSSRPSPWCRSPHLAMEQEGGDRDRHFSAVKNLQPCYRILKPGGNFSGEVYGIAWTNVRCVFFPSPRLSCGNRRGTSRDVWLHGISRLAVRVSGIHPAISKPLPEQRSGGRGGHQQLSPRRSLPRRTATGQTPGTDPASFGCAKPAVTFPCLVPRRSCRVGEHQLPPVTVRAAPRIPLPRPRTRGSC